MEQNYDKFGPWTDIYALGATLYTLLTNKKPPLPTDIDDDISEDKHEALPFPESVGGLRFLVLQMMKTNRLQRPQNIAAIMEAEKTRREEPKPKPKQQPTSKPAVDYDDEETIIAQPQPKKEEKKAEPKPEPKVEPRPSYTSAHPSKSDDSKGSGKGVVIGMIVALIFVIGILANNGGCGNKVEEANVQSVENTEPQITESEEPIMSKKLPDAIQLQWYSYLRGELTDETRIDSPYIAMQTAFLSEGVVLSSALGRSVTGDEIKAMAKSIALREQETSFGTIKYDFDEYKA
jgi:serine/threonine protein kinase